MKFCISKKKILFNIWALINRGFAHQIVLFILDVFSCAFGSLSAFLFVFYILGIKEEPQNYIVSILLLNFFLVFSFYTKGGYKKTFLRRQEKELEIIVKSLIYSFLIIFALNFIVFKSANYSRYLYFFGFITILLMLVISRFGLKRLYQIFWKNDIGREKALVIGNQLKQTNDLKKQLKIQQFNRFEFVGFIKVSNGKYIYYNDKNKKIIFNDIRDILEKNEIGSIFFTSDLFIGKNLNFHSQILNACKKKNVKIYTFSELFKIPHFIIQPDDYVGLFRAEWVCPELEKPGSLFIKRFLDIVISFVLIVMLCPLLIMIAFLVKIQDGGPILYKRRVVGKNGVQFYALKFRTMVVNADKIIEDNYQLKKEFKKNYKLKNDPRLTFLGKILRKLSIDELPQLFNVIVGQMSLVGPRMVTPEELNKYGDFKKERIKVKPGISGYWQVSGRQNVDYSERIMMDRFYIYRWNIWMDIWILLKTIQKVLKMEGAY